MALTTTFESIRERRINWRRELPPVLAVAGLAADYLSPAALWTILLPFGAVVMLIALRKWAFAATVFLLSSWVLTPLAVGTVAGIEEARGDHRLFTIAGANLSTVEEAALDPCLEDAVDFEELPIGSGHIIDPRWVMRETIETFAEMHNAIVIERMLESPSFCSDP